MQAQTLSSRPSTASVAHGKSVRAPVVAVRPSVAFRSRRHVSVRRAATTLEAPASSQVDPNSLDWATVAEELDTKSPLEIMDHALATFGDELGIAWSGAEDVALIEYAHLTGRPYRVFSLDTGRLNPETYQVFQAVEKHYGIKIEYTFPDAQETMDLVRSKGMFSFYEDGHGECCRVRKVRPLRRQLRGLRAWVTGQRKDQSPGTRSAVPVVQVDPVFEGLAGEPGSLVKYNPLSNMSSAEVWNFLRVMGVPTNALHAQGYVSIGCEPCTRPVLPGQHEREGRWWWEDAAAKECGLHSGNVARSAEEQAKRVAEARDLWQHGHVAALSRAELEGALKLPASREEHTLLALYAPWCPHCQRMEPAFAELAEELQGSSVRVAKFQADVEREFAAEEFGLKTFPLIVFLPKNAPGFIKYPSERRDVETLKMWVKAVAGEL